MKQLIRLTEDDLRRIVKESVQRILEGAFDKYQNDLMNIELDRNMNVDNLNFGTAYAQLDDPMVKKIKGSTMRSMMQNDKLGNNITN